jgi:hypothetical protein
MSAIEVDGDAEVRETLAAKGMFDWLCEGAASAAESGEVTQDGLLYSLWCFLGARMIDGGVSSEEMYNSLLYMERRRNGQERLS